MTDDRQLLRQYEQDGSESAFGELVTRHIDLVYSAALRVVNGDSHLAQDVTQSVFIHLARKVRSLPREVVLAGWLHRHTCFTAATAVRAERRRRAREQTAMHMRALEDPTEARWDEVAPHLDAALNKLSPADRDALVLRFLQRHDLRAVGQALGISEDAAQKRVTRALEKLRSVLGRTGLAVGGAALATALAADSVTAAPASLAGDVSAASIAAGAKVGTGLAIINLMAEGKLRIAAVGAVLVASAAAPLLVQHQAEAKLLEQGQAMQEQNRQIANWRRENDGLSNLLTTTSIARAVPNEQFREVLRLRGEIGLLRASVQELALTQTNRPRSREDVLASLRQMYLDRVTQLKQAFQAHPGEAVPELQYLTERDWLKMVTFDSQLDATNGYRRAMSSARSLAQLNFVLKLLSIAVWDYGKRNNGQFPTELSQLKPYFKLPVDDSVLQDWAILPMTSLPEDLRIDGDWVITQKGPVNADVDQRLVVGLKSTRLGGGGAKDWAAVP